MDDENADPIAKLTQAWLAARTELASIEAAGHPDITDRFGRVWTWRGKSLYRHCGNAAPEHMIQDFGLPTQAALDNPNYDLCAICLNGRERHVKACRREWSCSHATCARMHAAKDD